MIVQSENISAFEAWVREHEAYAYRFAFSILMHTQDAQDAVCEAFYKVFRNGTILERENPTAYLLTVVHHCCYDILRKRKRLIPVADVRSIQDALTGGDFDQSLDIEQTLKSLPHDMRTAIVLRYYYDWSYEQIAELLRIKTGTVASRINRAKKRLEAQLER